MSLMPLGRISLPHLAHPESSLDPRYEPSLLLTGVVPERVRVPERAMGRILKSPPAPRRGSHRQQPAPRCQYPEDLIHQTDRAVCGLMVTGRVVAMRDVLQKVLRTDNSNRIILQRQTLGDVTHQIGGLQNVHRDVRLRRGLSPTEVIQRQSVFDGPYFSNVHYLPHICASVGRIGRIPRLRCSAASCLGVSPAHTPCMSAAGNSRA